jgi:hypothetical protein
MFDLIQKSEFQRFIKTWYHEMAKLASHVAAILASHVAISTITSRGGHNKQGAVASTPRRPLLMWFPSRQLLDTPAATNSVPVWGQCMQGGTLTRKVREVQEAVARAAGG